MSYRWLSLSVAAFLLCIPTTQAAWHDLPDWLSPTRGDGTFNGNVRCYNLPFGVLGFVSHLISYWNVFWLLAYRRPWWPKKLVKYKKINLVTSSLSLIGTVGPSIITLLRCRSEWRFEFIAVWKIIFGVSVFIIGYRTAIEANKIYDEMDNYTSKVPPPLKPLSRKDFSKSNRWGLLLYAIGVLVGLIGLIAVVVEEWHPVAKPMVVICCVFGGITALLVFILFLSLLAAYCQREDHDGWGFGFIMCIYIIIMFFAAMWSDWILAAISVRNGGTWFGVPQGYQNTIVFAVFIIARVLPICFI
jgi:hypothetical protein